MKKTIKGTITPAILIITSSFIIVIYGLLFLLSIQLDYSHRQVASEKALDIAEAGVNYYRWHLAHDPIDFEDGTGATGPYIHDYLDPQGSKVGQYSLDITPPSNGSSIVTIESTAWTDQYPKVKRKIIAKYGIPSLSTFSFLSNGSVWYGSGVTVNGKVHSNNGIRMDGTNTSLVTSAQDTYQCGTETGCFPPEDKPGVWGAGGDTGLWQFPVPIIDFDTISLDMASMRTAAQSVGLYLPPSNKDGYHLIFFADGSVNVYKVNTTSWIEGYSVPGQGLGELGKGGCRKVYQNISDETLIGTYNLSSTPVIFAEDDLWVEGTVHGRTTVAAGKFPIQSSTAVIWIKNSIKYTTYDGSDVLGLVAQDDIYFTRDVPDNFQVDAVMLAQRGKIIRHGYFSWCGGTYGAVKNSLTINGSIISYFKSYWNFGTAPDSGFITRTINYDSNVLYSPPPYFPTSGEYEIISWQEE